MSRKGKSLVTLRGTTYYENFTVNGHRFRASLDTDDRETAEIIAAKTRSDALLGKLVDKKPEITLDAALGRYWLEHAHELPSANDIKFRANNLRNGIGKDLFLSAITPAILTDYTVRRRNGKIPSNDSQRGVKVTDGTVNLELHLLRTVIRRARDRWDCETPKIIWRDILLVETGERQHILSRSTPEWPQEQEEERLFNALPADFHAFVRFGLITGARFGNILMLTWGQVRWTEGHIVLRIKSKKPGGALHYIPITKAIKQILLAELGRHPTRVFTHIYRRDYYDRETKTLRRKGERYPFTRGVFKYHWRLAVKAAGLWYFKKSPDNFRIHDLRHTSATRALAKCRNLKTVQKMLGHKKIDTTGRYAATLSEDVSGAMEWAD
jgi:integrase